MTPISPRIQTLQDMIGTPDQQTALNTFWVEVEAQGTPLFDPIDDTHCLLTFVVRSEDAESITVISNLGAGDFADKAMTRFADTDVWYRSYVVERGFRMTYAISLNEPLTPPTADDYLQRVENWLPDPLNDKQWHIPAYDLNTVSWARIVSIAEAPDAPPQTWHLPHEGVPRGTVTSQPFHSDILDNDRELWVYLPPDYDSSGDDYPLLIAFDGWEYLHLIQAPHTLDNMIASGTIAPCVMVMVGNVKGRRDAELTCNPDFARCVTDEILPLIQAQFRVRTASEQVTLSGCSFGGLTSTWLAVTHPHLFGNVLSLSGAFWWKPPETNEFGWLMREIVQKRPAPKRIFMDVGTHELARSVNYPGIYFSNHHMRDLLTVLDWEVHYHQFHGHHEYLSWRGGFADGLITLSEKNV